MAFQDVAKKAIRIAIYLGVGWLVLMIGLAIFFHKLRSSACADHKSDEASAMKQFDVRWSSSSGLSGRAMNQSSKHVYGFFVSTAIEDCSSGGCVVVDRDGVYIRLSIPPGEARDFTYSSTELRSSFGGVSSRPVITGTPSIQRKITSVDVVGGGRDPCDNDDK